MRSLLFIVNVLALSLIVMISPVYAQSSDPIVDQRESGDFLLRDRSDDFGEPEKDIDIDGDGVGDIDSTAPELEEDLLERILKYTHIEIDLNSFDLLSEGDEEIDPANEIDLNEDEDEEQNEVLEP